MKKLWKRLRPVLPHEVAIPVQVGLWWRRNRVWKRIRGKPVDPPKAVELTSERIEVEVTEGSGMLQGKLTYTGIAATALGVLLGWVGLGDCTAEMMAEYGPEACQQASAVATALVDKVVVALGLVVAVIGRIRAARREKALRGE